MPTVRGYCLTQQLRCSDHISIYRALRETDGQPVAIKIPSHERLAARENLKLRHHYEIARQLEIPGIIRVYSLELYGNGYALVTEDFNGLPLGEYIQNQSLTLETILPLVRQLAEILQHLHQRRIIHQNLNPDSILICPETQEIKLDDLGMASLLPKETQTLKPAALLAGNLAYMAPEQTGRMNRGVDYRTDFYALGVTFYQLLTGQALFESDDPLELVHCHLAKTPIPAHRRRPEIPVMVSAIADKLLAKNAEDRYQSALGLKHDLAECLRQQQESGEIAQFELGQRDISDRFAIPEKLYGREAEVRALLTAFEETERGTPKLVLIRGFSGVGKTAVVNQIHQPIVRQRGYFIQGKFDQLQRYIPFSAFVQAFQELTLQLLAEPDRELRRWQQQILTAVGDNGQILMAVIPELARIIGEQPAVPELAGSATENRFHLVFQQFVQVFTASERPLVLFLDDLQWADAASLKLLNLLMPEQGHLLVIGAYRDREVSPAHPLMLTVEEMQKNGVAVQTIALAPLTFEDINQLVADTLKCDLDRSRPLTTSIYQKTKGNPFFTTQLLKSIERDGLISFAYEVGQWQYDLAQMRSLNLTDDVVDFMTWQLQKLSTATQAVLQLAAGIGIEFDLDTLAVISNQSATAIAAALWEALEEGFILPTDDSYKFFTQGDRQSSALLPHSLPNATYKFSHDRLQQAAYSLLSEEQKQWTHWQIGQYLLHQLPDAERENKIFALVNHLNIAQNLITQPSVQAELVQLNLAAALKAKASTAYAAALQYLTTAIELLPKDSWETQYELTRTLYETGAEVAYLSSNYPQMEQLTAAVLSHTDSLIEQTRIYEIKMLAAKAQAQFGESVRLGLQVLQLLGVEFPPQPTLEDIGQALEQTRWAWQERSISSLADLPEMTDEIQLAIMRILTQMSPSAYITFPALLPLLICKQIDLAIANGNCNVCTFSYADYGIVLSGVIGDLEAGYQFGQLALHLLDRFQVKANKSRTYAIFHSFISHYSEPLKSLLPRFIEAYQVGLETGDLECSGLNALVYCASAYFAGSELTALAAQMESYRQNVKRLQQKSYEHFLAIYQQTVENFLGRAEDPCQLIGKVYDETRSLALLLETNNRAGLYYLYYNKTVLCYFFGEYQLAANYAAIAESYADSVAGTFAVTLLPFYRAAIYLALYESASKVDRATYLERVAACQQQLKPWAERVPANHLHRFYLLEAERARVLGNKAEAIENYDRAIELAQAHGYLHEEALARELAAKFYLSWGKAAIAKSYMMAAYEAYRRWGATAKVDRLVQSYPQLLDAIELQPSVAAALTIPSSIAAGHSISDTIDLATMLKVSQSLAGEIELEKLLSTLLQIVLENAGADRCVLLMPQEDGWAIEAMAQLGQSEPMVQSMPLENAQLVPLSSIETVKRTLQPLTISHLDERPTLAADPYFQSHSPQSILCTPMLKQGQLMGILYLENHLATGAFTSDRVELYYLDKTMLQIRRE